jgi:hypothetical protein
MANILKTRICGGGLWMLLHQEPTGAINFTMTGTDPTPHFVANQELVCCGLALSGIPPV